MASSSRMMDRFVGNSRDVPNMVDVKFEQSPTQDKNSKCLDMLNSNIDIRLYLFLLHTLCISFATSQLLLFSFIHTFMCLIFICFPVNIEVNNVHIVANLEFLVVLSKVFTSALAAAPSTAPPVVHVDPTQAAALVAALPAPVDQEPPELRLQFALRQPEIVLLADAKDKATNALFLKVNLPKKGPLEHAPFRKWHQLAAMLEGRNNTFIFFVK